MTDSERRDVIANLGIDLHGNAVQSAALAETVLAGLNYEIVSSLKGKLENATPETALTVEEVGTMASCVLHTHLRMVAARSRQTADLASKNLKGESTNV